MCQRTSTVLAILFKHTSKCIHFTTLIPASTYSPPVGMAHTAIADGVRLCGMWLAGPAAAADGARTALLTRTTASRHARASDSSEWCGEWSWW